MGLGEKIKSTRKNQGLTLGNLSSAIGVGTSTLSKYENRRADKHIPYLNDMCKIAVHLNDITLLTDLCSSCPVRKNIISQQYPDLKNSHHDLSVFASRICEEMVEAIRNISHLSEHFPEANLADLLNRKKKVLANMDEVVEIKQRIDLLVFKLILSEIFTPTDLQKEQHNRQQEALAANDNQQHSDDR
ncbi:MAG: helix-turn-helix transcriptional regulator [Desulfobulbaceae bacterium]|nr:helix-turn-helix transcriptional regulator [Desulfobulbaceae bacterium]